MVYQALITALKRSLVDTEGAHGIPGPTSESHLSNFAQLVCAGVVMFQLIPGQTCMALYNDTNERLLCVCTRLTLGTLVRFVDLDYQDWTRALTTFCHHGGFNIHLHNDRHVVHGKPCEDNLQDGQMWRLLAL